MPLTSSPGGVQLEGPGRAGHNGPSGRHVMAQAFSVEEIIGRPAPQVWAALVDWPNAHRWMPGIDTIAADGQTAEGTRLTFRARGKDRSSTVVWCVAGQSIVLRSVQGGVRADYAYEVRPHDEGASLVTLTADCQSAGVRCGPCCASLTAQRTQDEPSGPRQQQPL